MTTIVHGWYCHTGLWKRIMMCSTIKSPFFQVNDRPRSTETLSNLFSAHLRKQTIHTAEKHKLLSQPFPSGSLPSILLTSPIHGRSGQIPTQKGISITSKGSVGSLSSNSVICITWKDSMKLSVLMLTIVLDVFTAVEMF